MKRIKRITIYTLLLYIIFNIAASTSIPWLEERLIQIGIPPYWDASLMEMIKWNRLVRKYGIKRGDELFNQRTN